MKKETLFLTCIILAVSFMLSCGAQSTSNNESETQTVTAQYINGGSLEGDADMIFKTEDGKEIVFYRNFTDPNEPELKFQFIDEDGASPKKELLGQWFVISYKVNPKGRLSMQSGEFEKCNQMLTVEKK